MAINDDFDGHFYAEYNTPLTPKEEAAYQKWAEERSKIEGRDVLEDQQDYDLRGYWKKNANAKVAANSHLTDEFKKPNHPTFSEQSKYSGTDSPFGGKFKGGTWAADGSSFTPSAEMLKTTHPLEFLQRYMSEREPGVKLNLDRKSNGGK